MTSLLSLVGGLWAHVGPGLLLVLALPVLLIIFGAIVAQGFSRADRSATARKS